MNPISFLKYFKILSKKEEGIFVNENEMKDLIAGERIPFYDNYSTLTVELLKSFVDDKKYYKRFLNDLVEKDNSKFSFIIEDELGRREYLDYKKMDIISAYEWAKDNEKLKEDEIEKFKLLKMSSELSAFIDRYKGEVRSTTIDGRFVTLPVKSFIDMLSMNKEELQEVIKKDTFNDLSLNEFVFALDNFLDETRIFDRFDLPDTYIDNLNTLKEIVDITYFNRCIDSDSTYLKKVNINEDLKDELFHGIRNDFSKLEQAFYIYHKMCYLLTYDEEQFARRENRDYEIAHHDFDRIEKITSTNNRIVCYEFNAIFASMLKEIGLNYELIGSREYSSGHASLSFRADKFIVSADSTIGLIKSDLSYAKNGMKLCGFTLENTNDTTKKEFDASLSKVYSYIDETTDNKYVGTVRDLKIFNEYVPNDIGINTRATLFAVMSNNSNLPSVDKIPYQLELKNKLFPKKENDKSIFKINYLSKKEESFDKLKVFPICLATVNANGVDEDITNNRYIEINGVNVKSLSLDEVKYKFKTKEYAYPKNNNREVPGLFLTTERCDNNQYDSISFDPFERDKKFNKLNDMFSNNANAKDNEVISSRLDVNERDGKVRK